MKRCTQRVRSPMAPTTINGIEELQNLVGETVGPSDWRTVTQEMINGFAEISGDHQWIHVDIERAKRRARSAARSPTAT